MGSAIENRAEIIHFMPKKYGIAYFNAAANYAIEALLISWISYEHFILIWFWLDN